MTDRLETIYEQIGAEMVSSMPGEWSEAWIIVDVAADVVTMTGAFQHEGQQTSFLVSSRTARLFLDLRNRIAAEGSDRWDRARFTLKPDGEFKLDFEY